MTDLAPGANAHLTRENPGLQRIAVGLSWDCGQDLTLREGLVPLILLCTARGHVVDQDHVVFHNQMTMDSVTIQEPSGSSRLPDDEQVVVDLIQVPPEVERIVFVLTVDAATTSRHLGHLRSCQVRIRDDADGRVLVESVDLVPQLGHATAAVLVSVYRLQNQWKCKVHAAAYSRGLAGVADDYGFAW